MFGILLKKQLAELFRAYYFNPKKNKARSNKGVIGMFVLFFFVMVTGIGGMFTGLSIMICPAMIAADMEWLFFCLLGLLAILMGALGSVFATYSGLYMAKDNDQMLAMPIPVPYIIGARLASIYLMGLMYSSMVMLPAIIVHWCFAGITVQNFLGGLIALLLISVVVLVLACLLGWVVAKIGQKLKNKSIVVVLVALAGFTLYYILYFRAQVLIKDLVANAAVYGASIKGSAYALYVFGRMGEGDWLSILICIAAVALAAGLTWLILQKTFMGIATSAGDTAKIHYREKSVSARGVRQALLARELAKFKSSPNYMLNSGLGLVFMVAASVFLLIKANDFAAAVRSISDNRGIVTACAAITGTALLSMVETTSPSVSLEGNYIWIAQSLPVSAWQVLRAKMDMQLVLTALPLALFAFAAIFVAQEGILLSVLLLLFLAVNLLSQTMYGLFANLKFPNIHWTNEVVPIKQGGSVLMSTFTNIGLSLLMAGSYFLASLFMGPELFLGIWVVILSAICCILYRWIKNTGARIFTELS